MTFTKEQLQHIIEADHVQCGDASALARMALAGMEAEPVGCPKCNDTGMADSGGVQPWGDEIMIPCDCSLPDPELTLLVHDLNIDGNHRLANVIQDLIEVKKSAPQPLTTSERAELENYRNAQQVVPECHQRLLHHAYGMTMGHDWNKGTMAGHHREKLRKAVEDCCAAMLHGDK